ncbi:hypothetical protein, partial [Streptomyces sp. N35]|uniref:DUF6907 domain-containing protein n=1 Tax=Streptomyces sp. N35 TaxID=2795730 RepID=UPI001F20E1A5
SPLTTFPVPGGAWFSFPCPSWCVSDHAADLEGAGGRMYPEDVVHRGAPIWLGLEGMKVLGAYIQDEPYGGDGRPPYLVVHADGDRVEAAELDLVQADQLIVAMREHAGRLVALRNRLASLRNRRSVSARAA